MIFSISKSVFAKAVALIAPVTSKSTLQILDYIVFRSLDDQHIELQATNLAQHLRLIMKAQVAEPGSVALWSTGLVELLGALPDAKLDLRSSERNHVAEIKCGRHKSSLKGLDPVDAPLFPSVDGLQLFEISPGNLIDMLGGVVDCLGDESRPALSGVNLSLGYGKFKAVATNSYHLGVASVTGNDDSFNALVPGKSAQVLKKVLDLAGSVRISIGESAIGFNLVCGEDDITAIALVSSLLSFTYPDVNVIVPRQHTTEVEIEVSSFLDALESAKMFITSKTHDGISLRVEGPGGHTCPDGRVLIFAHGEDGDFTGEVPAFVSGNDLSLVASRKYLYQAIKASPTTRVVFTGTTPLRPIVFSAAADCPVDWFHLIMPFDPPK